MTAMEKAQKTMDARDRILGAVSDFGPVAKSTALSVLAGTPPEALLNPLAETLIVNYSIGEAIRAAHFPGSEPKEVK